MPGVATLAADMGGAIAAQGFFALPVKLQHGQLAGALPGPYGDPLYRMLMAQALLENPLLVSNETLFDIYGVHRLW